MSMGGGKLDRTMNKRRKAEIILNFSDISIYNALIAVVLRG